MLVSPEFTFTVDGAEITTDLPATTVREVLRMASDASGISKFDRVLISEGGTEYLNQGLTVMLRSGSAWRTRRAKR